MEIDGASGKFCFDTAETITADSTTAHSMRASVVPVLLRHAGGRLEILGTAFCILASSATGEAVYATAAHVIDCLDPDRQAGDSTPDTGIEPFILLPRPEGDSWIDKDLHGVRVVQICKAITYSDVALLVVNFDDGATAGLNLRQFPLSFAEPVVGRKTMALGYPQIQGRLSDELVASHGQIEEVHPCQRDRSLSTFPTFRTTGNYPHGMSGGPIFDDGDSDGETRQLARVIGMVSSGMDTSDDAPMGYGASVASLMEIKVDLHVDDGSLHELSIADLVAMGSIHRSDHNVTLRRSDEGVTLSWSSDDSEH